MKEVLLLLSILIITFFANSQNKCNDLIVNTNGDSIICKIGLVNDVNIFYQTQEKRELSESKAISLELVKFIEKNGKKVDKTELQNNVKQNITSTSDTDKTELQNSVAQKLKDDKIIAGNYLISAGMNYNRSLKLSLIGITTCNVLGIIVSYVNPTSGLAIIAIGTPVFAISSLVAKVKGNKDLIKAGKALKAVN